MTEAQPTNQDPPVPTSEVERGPRDDPGVRRADPGGSDGPGRQVMAWLHDRPSRVPAALVVMVGALCAVAPSAVAPRRPDAVDPSRSLAAPSVAHLFGTDQLGRDVLSRVVYGARPSLEAGLMATVLGLLAGSLVGLVAGLGGRWVDMTLMRVVDLLLAFPAMLLTLMVVAIIGPGTTNVAVAVGVAQLPNFARLMRAEVLGIRTRRYVEAAVACGVRPVTVAYRHVLPNAAGPVLVVGTIGIGVSILASSSLSFLGFGPRPPTAEWGAMVADARDFVGSAWWMATFPGLAIVATVLALRGVIGVGARSRIRGPRW